MTGKPEQAGPGAASAAPAYRFQMHDATDRRAQPIRAYIHACFARCYGADVRDFMPRLMAMTRGDGIKAGAGLRTADGGPLFLEQYLDRACELELAGHFGLAPPRRARVAEVGNLAATESRAARELFVHIAVVARRLGLEWLTCNATRRVQAMLAFMDLPFVPIRDAARERVREPERWGSYYDQPSTVMAGPVAGIIDAMLDADPFRVAFAECRARATSSSGQDAAGRDAISQSLHPVEASHDRA